MKIYSYSDNIQGMNITWYGQSCFRIEVKDTSILIDPFSKEIGLRAPRIKDDLVLTTHDHYDHHNLADLSPEALAKGEAFLIEHPGEYERKGIYVRGIRSFHDKAQGVERGLNTIYIIRADDISICHLGDLGQEELSDTQIETIGDTDVLMVPVGGTYTLDAKEAAHVVGQIEPRIIIPMHYKVSGLTISLDGPDKFIKEIGLMPEKLEKLKLAKKTIPTEETKLVVFTL